MIKWIHTLSLFMVLVGHSSEVSSRATNKSSNFDYVNILENTCKVYDFMRTDNGLYLDSLYKNKDRQKRNFVISTASTGAGLISLAISHNQKIDNRAEAKVEESLKTLLGLNDIKPERNKNGLFRHFFSTKTGKGKSEFSSIDTALLIAGVNFCRNEFQDNSSIQQLSMKLIESVNWQSCKKNDMQYYMVQDVHGKPAAPTKIFNEYLLLADLCSWQSESTPIKINPQWTRAKLNNFSVLSDMKNRMLPLFTFAFPLYLSPYRSSDSAFHNESVKAALADKSWWNTQVAKKHLWGTSAGASMKGYSVDHPGKNSELYLHSPSVLSFAPFHEPFKKDFQKIIETEENIFFEFQGTKIPWRLSVKNQSWSAHRVEGVDLSPLLFGAMALSNELGFKYFQKRSQLP